MTLKTREAKRARAVSIVSVVALAVATLYLLRLLNKARHGRVLHGRPRPGSGGKHLTGWAG